MKTATVRQIKDELLNLSSDELIELCLKMTKFKKDNKELLTYLLFEADNEHAYVESVKREIDTQFEQINTSSYFYIKKSVRKILRLTKKHIQYSKRKDTEADLLIYFCSRLKNFSPSIENNPALVNLYDRQISAIRKAISTLHEDLQYDFETELYTLTF